MMTSSEDVANSAFKFGKLNGSNYQSWAFNMRLYLESMDLFEHAEGLAVAPSGSGESGAASLRNFNSRAKKAWMYICLAVWSLNSKFMSETQKPRRKLGMP